MLLFWAFIDEEASPFASQMRREPPSEPETMYCGGREWEGKEEGEWEGEWEGEVRVSEME
jgi:hypothetical protein